MTIHKSHLEKLKNVILLDLVPGFAELISDKAEFRSLAPNQTIAHKGKPIDVLIIPLSHEQALTDPTHSPLDSTRNSFFCGGVFELQQVLENGLYSCDFIAGSKGLDVLTLHTSLFFDLIHKQSVVSKFLINYCKSKALRDLCTYLRAHEIPPVDIVYLLSGSLVELDPIQPNCALELTPNGDLVFIENGEVRINGHKPAELNAVENIRSGGWIYQSGSLQNRCPNIALHATKATKVCVLSISDSCNPAHLNAIHALTYNPWVFPFKPSQSDENQYLNGDSKGNQIAELALKLNLNLGRIKYGSDSGTSEFAKSIFNIALLLGSKQNIQSIEEELSLENLVTPLRIAQVLEYRGFVCRSRVASILDIKSQPLPALVVTKQGRPLVLIGAQGDFLNFIDPLYGPIQTLTSDFFVHWDGRLIEISRSPFEKKHSTNLSHTISTTEKTVAHDSHSKNLKKGILTIIQEWRGTLVQIVILVLLVSLFGVARPILMGFLTDEVLYSRSSVNFSTYAAGLVLVLLLSTIASYLVNFMFNQIAARFEFTIASLFYRHILGLSVRDFAQFRRGDIVARLNLIWNLRGMISGSFIMSISSLLLIFVVVISLFFYSTQVGIIMSLTIPVFLLAHYFSRPLYLGELSELFKLEKQLNAVSFEGFSAIAQLKSVSAEIPMLQRRYEEIFHKVMETRQKFSIFKSVLGSILNWSIGLICLIATSWSAHLSMRSELSTGDVVAISTFLTILASPVLRIAEIFGVWRTLGVTAQRLTEVFKLPMEISPEIGAHLAAVKLRGEIQFDQVGFRYDDESPWIIKDISFSIQPGQWIAIIGQTGSGKSTIAKLISGQIKPTTGRVLFDGIDSKIISPYALRRQLGFVMQDHDLFEGSIAENITYSEDTVEDQSLERAARAGGVLEYSSKLHRGLNFKIFERGAGLSGGERQRINLSRGLYGAPEILLLDEFTSSLDSKNEHQILENLKSIRQNRTTVFVTHRLNLLKYADYAMIFKQGILVEQGTPTHLFESSTYLKDLLRIQIPEVY